MKNIYYRKRNIKVHFVDPKKSLQAGDSVIREQFKKAMSNILKEYDLENIAYVVFDAPPSYTIPPLGFGAYTTNENTVIVNINPKFAGFPQSLENELVHMIAHETAHAIRMRYGQAVHNLFDALIFEGLADHFGERICGSPTKLWHQKYYDQVKIPYALAKKEAKKKQDLERIYREWFTEGDPKRDIPWTAGYALGKQIVGDYLLSHPRVTPSQILGLNSKEFAGSFIKVTAV